MGVKVDSYYVKIFEWIEHISMPLYKQALIVSLQECIEKTKTVKNKNEALLQEDGIDILLHIPSDNLIKMLDVI